MSRPLVSARGLTHSFRQHGRTLEAVRALDLDILRGETRTAAIAIYDQVQALDYEAAGATAAALLIFSFVALAVTYSLERQVWAVWPKT